MTRHWFTSSLIAAALVASTSLAQVYTDLSPGDQRVSQLRPGFQREGIDPAATRGRIVMAPAPVELVDDSESTTHSFLPKWLDWRKNKTESPPNSKQKTSKNSQGKSATKTGPSPNVDNDSQLPDPATVQNGALPGLGGSPVPRSNRSQTNAGATGGIGANTPKTNARVSPSASQSTKSAAIVAPGMRMAAREATPPSAASPSSNSEQAPRSSPVHRTAPNISADELRRELSGTFSATKTPSESNAGSTAQADKSSDSNGESLTPVIASDASPPAPDPSFSEAPATSAASAPTTAKLSATVNAAPATQSATNTGKNATGLPSTNSPPAITRHARSAYGKSSSVTAPTSTASAPQTSRGKEVFGETTANDPNVLVSTQTPVLSSDIRGPKQILVGRESLYRVRLQNQSDVPADGIVASVRIPSGAEVVNTTATQGSVQPSSDPQSGGQLQWHLSHLDRHATETLEIRLVPRENKPLELGVSWTLAPVGSHAVVEVQEAKLNLEITGPTEVLFDKPQSFKLTLANPGTGPAENVKIDLLPPGGSQDKVTSHQLGTLAAGASQTVEVELTARESGKMAIKGTASADGGLKSEFAKEIFCRKPELAVDWRGPATKYAGTMATYFIRVRNPGTAPAQDVTIHATLPEGAEFTSASEGQTFDSKNRLVSWHVNSLNPGDDNYMELKCVLKTAGKNTLEISAANSAGNLSDKKTADTDVVAIADLKLDVVDPSGPVAVGAQAIYEIHVRNRGANAAKEINVAALFSDGIEPDQAEDSTYTVADGRVSFKPIDELPAGNEVTLKIRAHAVQPGTHVFRAEVLCRDLDTKLAAEETTRFYADDVSPNDSHAKDESASRGNTLAPFVKK